MLTISRLKRRSIAYYNDTATEAKQAAMDRQKANGGLAEYYSEGETRVPTWLVVGDKDAVARATGLTEAQREGGDADTEDARVWLDDGAAPNGVNGREFTDRSVHGNPRSTMTLRASRSTSAVVIAARFNTGSVGVMPRALHMLKVGLSARTHHGRGTDGRWLAQFWTDAPL